MGFGNAREHKDEHKEIHLNFKVLSECVVMPDNEWTTGVQLAALPLLGFSPKILGFSIESWVLRFFSEDLGFFQISGKNTFI